MTVKKYVNAIIKRVKCSREKKEEIKQQFMSDISAALENGESFENVMERIGTVDDAAEKINKNLPEQEIKKYKKNRRIRIICEVAGMLLLLSFGVYRSMPKSKEIGNSGIFEKSVVEETAKQVIIYLNTEDFDALRDISSEIMREAISAESLKQAKQQVNDGNFGEFISFGEPYMVELEQKGETYAVAQIGTSYENTSITYTITFNKDMKLYGLYMK